MSGARVVGIACSLLLIPVAPLLAQRAVPIRELGAVEATSAEPFKNVFGVRALPNGNVLVNDALRRQLVVLDAHLSLVRAVLDTNATDGHNYGSRPAPTIPYTGDSTLFVDVPGSSLLVIDPTGKVARVMSAPNPRDLATLYRSPATADAAGNLVYAPAIVRYAAPPAIPGGKSVMPPPIDSHPVVRANFETRKVDTIGRVKVPTSISTNSVQLPNGKMQVTKIINPLTTVDVWAVLTDGTVAFVRGHDYHIDFLLPNGERRSSEKLPFDWKQLTDADKMALVDSSRKAEEKALAESKIDTRTRQLLSQEEAARGIAPSLDPVLQYVPLKEMADYYPAIRYGAAIPDADNNLWILPTTSAQSKAGELIYDVVNNGGELTHRVRVPANRSIAGFGRGGIVYLMFRDNASIWHIERTRITNAKAGI